MTEPQHELEAGAIYEVAGLRFRMVPDNSSQWRSLAGAILMFDSNLILEALRWRELYRIDISIESDDWVPLQKRRSDLYEARARLRKVLSAGEISTSPDWWRAFAE
jgi:hypothetical protein